MPLNYDGQTRRNETIQLDGGSFVGTVFQDCLLRFDGAGMPNLDRCQFAGNTRFELGGDALQTMCFFVLMSHFAPNAARTIFEGIETMLKEMSHPSPKAS